MIATEIVDTIHASLHCRGGGTYLLPLHPAEYKFYQLHRAWIGFDVSGQRYARETLGKMADKLIVGALACLLFASSSCGAQECKGNVYSYL